MNPVQELWLMQVVWVVGPWLAFAMLLGLAFVAYSYLMKGACYLRNQAIGSGWSGLPKIFLSDIVLRLLVWAMFAIIFGVTIGTWFVFNQIQLELTRRYSAGELQRLTEEAGNAMPEISLDFILLLGTLAFLITCTVGVFVNRTLRREAGKVAARPRAQAARAPVLVTLYGRPRFAGILIILAGCYALFSLLMQIFYGLVLVVPLPASLLSIEVPGAFSIAIFLLLLMWLGIVIMLAGPVGALAWQRIKFLFDGVRENHVMLAMFKISVAFALFFCGFLINKWLQVLIGIAVFPDWFPATLISS